MIEIVMFDYDGTMHLQPQSESPITIEFNKKTPHLRLRWGIS